MSEHPDYEGPTGPTGPFHPAPRSVWARPGPEAGRWEAPWPPASGLGDQPPAGDEPPRRPRRAIPLVMAALLVVVAAGGGVEIGHAVWGPSGSVGVAAGNGGASSGSAGSGTGGLNGQVPNGTGGLGSGSSGSGSSGSSGSGSVGQAPSGSSGSSSSSASGAPTDTAAIAAKAAPALVDINVTFNYGTSEGAGTGIVLTSNGEILTNNHVINGATAISVTDVGNGKTYGAAVVGYDPTHDVAVLQLRGASGLATASLGDSSKAAVGQAVVGIGNAGGTGGTPSNAGGSITALNQSITAGDDSDGTSEQLSNLIQVNADIQPGDSGGALVNTAGQVIGMDTAASEGFSFQGQGQSSGSGQESGTEAFAIPINQAVATARQMAAGHGSSAVHIGAAAFLGVEISSGSAGGSSGGAAVRDVVEGTSAAKAGIAAGDVITSLGGSAVGSASALSGVMITHHPGDKVQVGWTDSAGQSHTTTVDLGSGPPA